MTDAATRPEMSTRQPADRGGFGLVALGAAVVSLLGFAVLFIGQFVAPGTFHTGKNTTTANNIAFFAYVFGLLIALFLGGAVTLYRRRSRRATGWSPALIALVYGVVFVVVGIVAAALGD